jgi:hypothetical protein
MADPATKIGTPVNVEDTTFTKKYIKLLRRYASSYVDKSTITLSSVKRIAPSKISPSL